MQDKTIILEFQQINNKVNKLTQLTQENIQQLYMFLNSVSTTLDSMTTILEAKGIMTRDEITAGIKTEIERRNQLRKESMKSNLDTQPVVENVDAAGPEIEDPSNPSLQPTEQESTS